MRVTTLVCGTLLLTGFALGNTAAAADWLQWGYDPAHTGNNPDEHQVSAANVAQMTRRYDITLPDNVDSAPVYAGGIQTPSGVRDLLFLTYRYGGGIAAIDALTGAIVWSHPVDPSGRQSHSSPAIDSAREYVYSYGVEGRVHKYAIGTGEEVVDDHWPQLVTLKPQVEKGASALAIATVSGTTYLYAVTNGYIGDGGDYQGHLTTIDLATGAQTVFNTLCSDVTIHMILNGQNGVTGCSQKKSGIWGRPGATYDAGTNRVYIATGNGLFDAHMGGLHWSDSVLALNPDGTGAGNGMPLDSYTPTDFQQLQSGDVDLGSASLLPLKAPEGSVVQHLGVQTGKDSRLHLLDLDHMGGPNAEPGGGGGAIEVIDVPISEFWMMTQPVTWVDTEGDGATWVYMANGSGISGLKLGLDGDNVPFLLPTWQKTTSATSAMVANNVVYHAGSCSGGKCMIARNPRTGDVLWTSPTIGSLHWQSPILVAGALYIAAGSRLHRFDLGDVGITYTVTPVATGGGSINPDTPQTIPAGDSVAFTLTADAGHLLASVTGCGGTLAGDTYTTGPVTADCTVSASFEVLAYTVTPTAGPGGSIDPDTPQDVDWGGTTSFTLHPEAGHVIAAVTGCGGSLAGDTYTTGAIETDCTVSASFTLDPDETVFSDGFDGTGFGNGAH